MKADETFEDTADILFQLVKNAAASQPDVRRHLFLDIEGHRNPAGGFDHDALELQKNFIVGYLGRWLSEVSMPLLAYVSKDGQHEDVPDNLVIMPGDHRRHGKPHFLRGLAQAICLCWTRRQANWCYRMGPGGRGNETWRRYANFHPATGRRVFFSTTVHAPQPLALRSTRRSPGLAEPSENVILVGLSVLPDRRRSVLTSSWRNSAASWPPAPLPNHSVAACKRSPRVCSLLGIY